jgi:uncharacterized protein YndB with AHSA1/START domain
LTTSDTATLVRKSITVNADQRRAFEVFTTEHGTWWPADYHIGSAEYETAVIEPFEGGRWYEVGVDGSESLWGHVLAWEPPRRLVLAWQISADWRLDPQLMTEIDVRFEPIDENRTQVVLEHRHLERFGARAADMRAIFEAGGVPGAPQGWAGILRSYANVVERLGDRGA